MPVISGGTIIEGARPQQLAVAGAPTNGTDEVQTLTIGGTPEASSTFRLTFEGWTTAPIAWSSTNNTLRDNVDAALEALPNIGTGGVATAVGTMTAGVGTLTITFSGTRLKKKNVGLIVGSAFLQSTGAASTGTVAVATTTPGVDATFRDAPAGAKLTDYTNGVDYVNTGVAGAPVWTAVSVGSIDAEVAALAAAIPATAIPDTGAIANHTAATAIAATYADLAAARTSVNALRTDHETALGELDTAIEGLSDKIDAILAMLRTAGILAS